MNLNRSYNMGERERESMVGNGRTLGMVIKEKDEELALFLEMRKREKEEKEKERENKEGSTDSVDPMQELKGGVVPLYNKVVHNTTLVRKAGIDDFLNSDNDKNDYDWLLTPPGTPLFPSLESQTKKSPVSRVGTPKSRPTALKSRLANPQDPPSRGSTGSTFPSRTTSSHSLTSATTRRPSSSGGLTSSRPATPTGRATLSSHSTRPSRPSTPTSRPILPSKTVPSKPVPAASKPASRSTTPSRSTVPTRSSTPSRTSSVPAPHPKPSLSRSSTPTRRNPNSTNATTTTVGPTGRSAPAALSRSGLTGGTKPSSVAAPPTRAASPSVRSRPWKPSDMPGFSLDAPPNLRTSLPSDRPSSASRGRPAAPGARSSSVDPGPQPNPRVRRQSCSPSRGRAPNGVSAPALTSSSRRGHMNGSTDSNSNSSLNPVMIGNKMVERVVHMRRLAPPKQESGSNVGLTGSKPALSPDGSSGFGRNLSKKSLDMALRHMDIRKSIPNNLRPLMTNIPASSMYSVRSGASAAGPTRSRQISVSDSPLATSSNASSEPSVNNLICLEGAEMDEDFVQQPIRL
ncbi:flocculation FLO11-like protein [Rhynchospora pubera]|uniref:Flocculation FLO11-like protein n=1 Tax=Rhynchospora pubera TaxID=906938 RepID=A0AAV8F8C0_9POAL|nr:flocculation FLO11-like protein [Rhynchospora pubera]